MTINKLFLILFLHIFTFGTQTSYAKEDDIHLISSFKTEDCQISVIEFDNEKFVVKQIMDKTPDEQFLLVLDAFACRIAESLDIPMNKVRIISPNESFLGKNFLSFPATIHTFALGVSTDKTSPYQNINLHQQKENSPWNRFLEPEDAGLTIAIIQNIAKHPDLPKIVALDTFLGNADRSAPNLYYDEITDRFCGIDLAASFNSPLALIACQHLATFERNDFTMNELSALIHYRDTLNSLIKKWPPKKQEKKLIEYGKTAGFKKESFLFDQNVIERMQFHIDCIKSNYSHCINLIEAINRIVI